VNEGPKKMAEVFLGGGDDKDLNDPKITELRALFRQFLQANSTAVGLHGSHAIA
jgi:hypothetical protein